MGESDGVAWSPDAVCGAMLHAKGPAACRHPLQPPPHPARRDVRNNKNMCAARPAAKAKTAWELLYGKLGDRLYYTPTTVDLLCGEGEGLKVQARARTFCIPHLHC